MGVGRGWMGGMGDGGQVEVVQVSHSHGSSCTRATALSDRPVDLLHSSFFWLSFLKLQLRRVLSHRGDAGSM